MRTFTGIILSFFLCISVSSFQQTHAHAFDTSVISQVIHTMSTRDKLLLFAQTIMDYPDLYTDLENTLLASLPILEYDMPPTRFYHYILPWAAHHLSTVLENRQFKEVMNIFIKDLNALTTTTDWYLNSGNNSTDRDYFVSQFFSTMDFTAVCDHIVRMNMFSDICLDNSSLDIRIISCTRFLHNLVHTGLTWNENKTSTSHQPLILSTFIPMSTQTPNTVPVLPHTNAIDVVCNSFSWHNTITLAILRQQFPNLVSSDIYLGKNTCSGKEINGLLVFDYGLDECLTSETIQNGNHIYTNQLIYAEHDPVFTFIIKHFNWTYGVQCDSTNNGSVTGTSQTNYTTSSFPKHMYPVNISTYSDPGFRHKISNEPLLAGVGSQIYVKVFSTTSDWDTDMKISNCYTKPSVDAADNLNYYLIKNGCEQETTTHVIAETTHETRFVFDNFEYISGHNRGIYVFCDVTFCRMNDMSRKCLQTCNP